MADLLSVIVTTYNRPDTLEAVLSGLARQTDCGFEIMIADDGSGPETAQTIARFAHTTEIPITHVWQADQGFRAAESRNRAILRSSGAYCIFLDGDCIPRRDFIARHRALAEPGCFVTGNRVLLSPSLSQRILHDGIDADGWGMPTLLRERLAGGVNRLAPALHLPLGPLRRLHDSDWEGARSCNLAVWRHDLDTVDGFDAAFSGWGLEDSDIVVRLIRAGVRRKDGRFATGVLHLWHLENDRAALPDNRQRLDAVIGSERIRALQGLSTLAQAPAVPAHRVAERFGVDAVYVLTVKTFTDRIAHVRRELARFNIPFEFIFDYDAAELTPDIVQATFGDSPMPLAHKSLVLKHREAWRRACGQNLRRILVFEDDAVLDRRFPAFLRDAMQAADELAPGWLIYLGGSDSKVSRDFILDRRPLIPRAIATTEGYVTDLTACERRLAWCAANSIGKPADGFIAQIDPSLGISHYWLPHSIVEQGSVTGKFTSALDSARLKHSRLYNIARNRWFKFRRRTFRTLWVRIQHAILRSGG